MKLRVRGDSIRLRLTQSDVTALRERGLVEESTAFGPTQHFVYALRTAGGAISASIEASRIEVLVPADVARTWAEGDSVGLEATQEAGGGRTLRILVEKDFACLTKRPHEDDTDAFPNPNTSC
jgi:hypothetical protein